MKRIITFLLAVVMCLFLVACGGGNNTAEDNAHSKKSVEITIDNWSEYFELREYTKFNENGFGEIDDAYTYWSLISRDEYVIDIANCDVTFEYTCDEETVISTIDTETKTVIYGEVTDIKTSDSRVESMNGVGQYIGITSNQRYGELLSSISFRMEDDKLVSTFDNRIANVTVIQINGTFSYFE